MTWPNLPQYLKEKAASFGEKLFLCDFGEETQYTYREVDDATDVMAGGLRGLGVEPGDRVALLHENHSDFILACLSIVKAGAVTVPVNPLYKPDEVQHVLEDSGALWLISTEDFQPTLEEVRRVVPHLKGMVVKGKRERFIEALVRQSKSLNRFVAPERSPEDLAFIFYTSGTTGRPKGVMLTHRNVTFGGGNTAQNYGLRETDVTIACLPLVHIFGNASPVFGSLNSGGLVVVMERFRTESVYQALGQYRVTWFPGVPTMFGYLLNAFDDHPRNLSTLRMGLSGGAPLPEEHATRFERVFNAPVIEVYGLTESTGLVTANPTYGVRKTGSIGITASGVSVRLVNEDGEEVPKGEVGELIFRGPNGTPGYWNQPDLTAKVIQNGWVHTGDLAREDEDGYFFIVGRKDELIICGGYNIYPRDIEEVLYLNGEISEAAVIGVTDPDLGQVPKAFVALQPGCRMTPESIREFCREHLAPYKIPRHVEIMGELPKNPTGKILKKALPGT